MDVGRTVWLPMHQEKCGTNYEESFYHHKQINITLPQCNIGRLNSISCTILLYNMQVEGSDQQIPKGNLKQQEQQPTDHKTLNHHTLYYSFLERYFTTYERDYQYLHRHSNGLFMIRINVHKLPSKPIALIDVLQISQVKGKKKRGGSRVQKDTVIIQIKCEAGEVLGVYALVDGVILQKNQRLTLQNVDTAQGYVAVINPTRKYKPDLSEFRQILLPHQLQKSA